MSAHREDPAAWRAQQRLFHVAAINLAGWGDGLCEYSEEWDEEKLFQYCGRKIYGALHEGRDLDEKSRAVWRPTLSEAAAVLTKYWHEGWVTEYPGYWERQIRDRQLGVVLVPGNVVLGLVGAATP